MNSDATTITCLAIPADAQHAEIRRLANDLETPQGLVGGRIEPVTLRVGDHGHTMWVNEEGKPLGLPCNETATRLAESIGEITPGDWIAGNAVVTATRPDGTEGDITEALLQVCARVGIPLHAPDTPPAVTPPASADPETRRHSPGDHGPAPAPDHAI